MASSTPVLIDTSVWIDALRGRTPSLLAGVRELLAADRARRCDVVTAELRAGLRGHERAGFLEWFDAVPNLSVELRDWEQAGDLARSLRARGLTVPLTDLLVATLSLRHDVPVWTLDHHFDAVEGLRRHPEPQPSVTRPRRARR